MNRDAARGEVHVDDGVMTVVEVHVASEQEREVGGILAGHLTDGRASVALAIPALRAEGHRANVTFTHDVWEDVLAELDRDHPDLRIVGWYHSHPGFGIFLSEYDQFIQTNFFSADGMLGLVMDPHTSAQGWFVTRAGAIERLDGDEPVGQPRDRADLPGLGAGVGAQAPADQPIYARSSVLVAAGLVGLLGLGAGWAIANSNAPTGSVEVDPGELAAAEQREAALATELDGLAGRLAEAEAELAATAPPPNSPSSPDAAESGGETATPMVTYRIRRGDTLTGLARSFSSDPDYLRQVVEANPRIEDPDRIEIGQQVAFPVTDAAD